MGTTHSEVREWLERAKTNGSTHLIVVVDTYDHDDYPVEVRPGEDVRKKVDAYNGKEMQRVIEVYALHLDLEDQLREPRSFHLEPAPAKP